MVMMMGGITPLLAEPLAKSDCPHIIDPTKFNDLFSDINLNTAFLKCQRIKSISINSGDNPYQVIKVNRDGTINEIRELDGGKPLRIYQYEYSNHLLRKTTLQHIFWNTTDTTTYTYNAQGQVATKLVKSTHTYTLTYTYDQGRLVSSECTSETPDACHEGMEYVYDKKGRLVKHILKVSGRQIVTITSYNAQGLPREIRRSGMNSKDNQDLYTMTYDAAGRLAKVTFDDNGKRIATHQYRYDEAGQLLELKQKSEVNAMGSYSYLSTYETY